MVPIKSTWHVVVGSPHHPLLLVSDLYKDASTIYDAELGEFYNQQKFAGPAMFIPDGTGLISSSPSGGLTAWDFRPLLEHREQRFRGEISLSNRDEPELSGVVIEGPGRVGLILFPNDVDADVLTT